MDIKYNLQTNEYELGNTKYKKEDFLEYIKSDMLREALIQEHTLLKIENPFSDILNHNLYGIHMKLKNDALSDSNQHICIGWSKLGDLSTIETEEELRNLYIQKYPAKNNKSIGASVSQIWRFISEAKIGDYVIFADKNVIHVGCIESDHFYDDTKREEQDPDYVNNRKVKWIKKNIDRSLLSENFSHSLAAKKSFFAVNDYKSAIVDILNGNYRKDEAVEELEEDTLDDYGTSSRLHIGANIILYGVPGAGKSYTIEKEYRNDAEIERVVFHPDYTYSDFVGQILPKSDKNGGVSYEFVPGPFTRIMKNAYEHPMTKYILIIEEINRGNAPAIFGDIFQLLDRDIREKINGEDNIKYCASAYEITNAEIAKKVYGDENHPVAIPANMMIICTMNTSDQNVFTLDTAFQRRWNMRLVENIFKKETPDEKEFAEHFILDTDVTWENFVTAINKEILDKNKNLTSSEDKRLGTHFVNTSDLEFDSNETSQDETIKIQAKLNNRRFPEKVIKYLWDDAFKFYRDEIFSDDLKSLEEVIKRFTENEKNDRFNIFKDTIKNAIEKKVISND